MILILIDKYAREIIIRQGESDMEIKADNVCYASYYNLNDMLIDRRKSRNK